METISGHDILDLTDLDTPELLAEQIDKFTAESIHLEKVAQFNPGEAVDRIKQLEGARVMGADYGGDKGTIRLFRAEGGHLVRDMAYSDDVQGNLGEGYLESLKKATVYAEANNIPLGVSWGGPLNGTELVYHPKATTFFDELRDHYQADLQKISPSIKAIYNDGPAGLVSGAVQAYTEFGASTVLFVINGGGLGLGLSKDNTLYATEAGHVEGVDGLNTYNQTEPCRVFDATHTCIERLGSNKMGIEAQWLGITGSYLRAKDIEDKFKEGDKLAAELNDHSAWVVSNMVQGTANAVDINLANSDVAVVGHGGAFKFPKYGERVQQILGKANNGEVHLIMTKNYGDKSSNACLDGAAIAALTAEY